MERTFSTGQRVRNSVQTLSRKAISAISLPPFIRSPSKTAPEASQLWHIAAARPVSTHATFLQRGNSNKLYEYHILLMLYFDALRSKRKQGEKPGGAVPPPRVSSFSKLKRSNYRPRHQIKKAGSANTSCPARYGKGKILFRELNTLSPRCAAETFRRWSQQ